MIDIYYEIERLLKYGRKNSLLEDEDFTYSRNKIMAILKLDEYKAPVKEVDGIDEELETPAEILENILNWASEKELIQGDSITCRDLFDTEIMDALLPRPSEVIKNFFSKYEKDPILATDYYYDFSKTSNYIRMDRIVKNRHWYTATEYGDLEITINLSKPEKDPKAIAAAKHLKSSSYPKCLLCKENEGYAGNLNHPARQNLRLIPVKLSDESWFFQYSPYVYYNEHCIIFSKEHTPMKISKDSMRKLLEFVEQYPHYFVGSNADLPIVGGSILSHDHFQGGRHEFPMAKAPIKESFSFSQFKSVTGGILKWPMSVIRIASKDRVELLDLADRILNEWREYNDAERGILAYSGEEPHNTITPIARKRGDNFELDLVLRNNRTSPEHPLGIFHPHSEVHNIKKENIGLIEVMGLAILPGRLKEELTILRDYILENDSIEKIKADGEVKKHLNIAITILKKYTDIEGFSKDKIDWILEQEVGDIFTTVLKQAGVYKDDEHGLKGFKLFLEKFTK